MSVLACDRKNCTKIMCDTLINGSYYLCGDCLKEFKVYMRLQSVHIIESLASGYNLEELIVKFMCTSPNSFMGALTVIERFDEALKNMIQTR